MKTNPYIKRKEAIEELLEIFSKLSNITTHTAYDDKFIIEIRSLNELHCARAAAKLIYKDWSDKLTGITPWYGDEILVSYEDERYPLIRIWFNTDVTNFPKELLPDKGCKFEKRITEGYVLVCPTGVK